MKRITIIILISLFNLAAFGQEIKVGEESNKIKAYKEQYAVRNHKIFADQSNNIWPLWKDKQQAWLSFETSNDALIGNIYSYSNKEKIASFNFPYKKNSEYYVYRLQFSPDFTEAFVMYRDYVKTEDFIYRCSLKDGTIELIESFKREYSDVALHFGKSLIASCTGGKVTIKDLNDKKKTLASFNVLTNLEFMEFSPSGDFLFINSEDPKSNKTGYEVFETASWKSLQKKQVQDGMANVLDLCFNKNENKLYLNLLRGKVLEVDFQKGSFEEYKVPHTLKYTVLNESEDILMGTTEFRKFQLYDTKSHQIVYDETAVTKPQITLFGYGMDKKWQEGSVKDGYNIAFTKEGEYLVAGQETFAYSGETIADYTSVTYDGQDHEVSSSSSNNNPYLLSDGSLSTEHRARILGKLLPNLPEAIATKVFEENGPYSFDELVGICSSGASTIQPAAIQMAEQIAEASSSTLDKLTQENWKQLMDNLGQIWGKLPDGKSANAGLITRSSMQPGVSIGQKRSQNWYYWPVDSLTIFVNKSMEMGTPGVLNNAKQFVERAMELAPSDPFHPAQMGMIFMLENNLPKAAEWTQQSMAIDPNYYFAHFVQFRIANQALGNDAGNAPKEQIQAVLVPARKFLDNAPKSGWESSIEHARSVMGVLDLILNHPQLYAQYKEAMDEKDASLQIHKMTGAFNSILAVGNKELAFSIASILAQNYKNSALRYQDEGDDYKASIAMDAAALWYGKGEATGLGDAKFYYDMVDAYNNTSQFDKADIQLKKAFRLFPNNVALEHMQLVSTAREAQTLLEKKDYKAIRDRLVPLLKGRISEDKESSLFAGLALYEAKLYKEAAPYLKEFTSNITESYDDRELLGYFPNIISMEAYAANPSGTAPVLVNNMADSKRYQEMVKSGKSMISSDFTAGMAKMEEAARALEKMGNQLAVTIAYSSIGVAYHTQKQPDKAMEAYKKSIAADPISSSSHNNLSLIYLRTGREETALPILEEGHKKFPKAADISKAFAEYYDIKAAAAYKSESWSNVISYGEKGLKYHELSSTHTMMGFAYYMKQQLSTAKSHLRRALAINPQLEREMPAIRQVLNQ